ncbi:MAG: hypothetical protein HN737_01560 [Desulfobacterales bacterium]|jgi:hypothetical protein|nr:hypothetical protein [Desulfobacteraceae bacterium]MBT4363507.1 hypothetical protein [Desulfobacteraceae bacterium]MBT7084977.1 hypothetical protein [Desulfobacterales bacterium]MBT7696076.1 hypothetical protein [Desulfobacterales bacterium]
MSKKTFKALNKTLLFFLVGFVVIVTVALVFIFRDGSESLLFKQKASGEVNSKIKTKTVLDYNSLGNDHELSDLMKKRKEKYGVDKGLDMIVKPGEDLTVGDDTVSMQNILDQTSLNKGNIIEKDLDEGKSGSLKYGVKGAGEEREALGEYGVYVVRPGDNIWNVHFTILKEYFETKNITISSSSDEPGWNGYSSGVGKLLKFSENMVSIYNLKEKRVDTNLNLIHELSKIVVYNMVEVFSLLDRIDDQNIDNLEFDGKTIWIPADQ